MNKFQSKPVVLGLLAGLFILIVLNVFQTYSRNKMVEGFEKRAMECKELLDEDNFNLNKCINKVTDCNNKIVDLKTRLDSCEKDKLSHKNSAEK